MSSLFTPTLPIREIIVRGTIVYLVLFGLLRLLRRGAGAISITDLLVIVLIAEAPRTRWPTNTAVGEGA